VRERERETHSGTKEASPASTHEKGRKSILNKATNTTEGQQFS
jgi:hypothetical protein